MQKPILLILFISLITFFSSCYGIRASKGGGQHIEQSLRVIDPNDIALPDNYKIDIVATGLTFPSGIAFDDKGAVYVIEAGYAYGEVWLAPRLLKIENGKTTEIAKGSNNGPWNGITFYEGNFYVAEGGTLEGGKILKISPEGKITPLVSGLPGIGDHHTNGPAIKNGFIYFSQGTATNSGVVGKDSYEFGWLSRNPAFHDIPCADITATGKNYETDNFLTEEENDKSITGPYSSFGTSVTSGQIMKGEIPCTGAILKMPVNGGNISVVAWGLRNPFGLAFDNNGNLFTTENSYDDRGSRPVWGTGDVLWKIKDGSWYGWPEYSAGKSLTMDDEFSPPGDKRVVQIINNVSAIPDPVAILGVHSSSNGFDFSFDADFGHVDEAFIAQFGDMAPGVGKVLNPVGFKVVMVNVNTGVINDFAVNKGKKNGPATMLGSGGIERPVDVKFNNDGSALYIADFGIVKTGEQGPQPMENTGVVWKISKIK